ncbi:MAG: DUF1217 domain-containing protein [Pseudomonadota bacterium]
MTFQPAIPTGGLAGLRFLDATYDRQFDTFSRSPIVEREIDYFRENAASATTAEALVGDRRLLQVALAAFGLEDELPKRALIRKVLEEGSVAPDSLANRLVDPAWRRFTAAMGYGDLGGRLGREGVREEIAEQYRVRQFERAVGDSDVDLRLALNFRREISDIAGSDNVDRTGWLRVIGSQPLRIVVLGALNLPDEIGALDVDDQVERISDRADRVFGSRSPGIFTEAAVVERAVERFLLTSAANSGVLDLTSPGGTALTLLQSGGLGAGAQAGLFASRF